MSAQEPQPVLSIVIPVYNERDTWRELLRRVERAAISGWRRQILLVDDGSTDGTRRQLEQFARERAGADEPSAIGVLFAAAYMLFIAVGHSVPFLTVAMVVMIAFAIGLLSQIPGMIGVAEITMTGFYHTVGIPPATALTVSIMTQMDSYLFEIGLGYVALLVMNFVLARREKKHRSVGSKGG